MKRENTLEIQDYYYYLLVVVAGAALFLLGSEVMAVWQSLVDW